MIVDILKAGVCHLDLNATSFSHNYSDFCFILFPASGVLVLTPTLSTHQTNFGHLCGNFSFPQRAILSDFVKINNKQ